MKFHYFVKDEKYLKNSNFPLKIVKLFFYIILFQDLKDFMRQAGEVTFADAHKEQKGEGVVEFASR
jgi:hypothetical protein